MNALLAELQKWLTLAILIALNALVFWQGKKRMFLWVLAGVANFIVGLGFTVNETQYSARWAIGVVLAVLGLYCLMEFALWALGNLRKSRNSSKEE